ncbi:MAG: hypothetical protein JO323_07105 [Acidobacteriia bacterium]|nr:hypothetical protein [Terriglobia bacterium]
MVEPSKEFRNTGGGMWKDTGTDNPANQAAPAMLEAFASAGASHFDITWTTKQGDKAGFRRHIPVETLRRLLPVMLLSAARTERNLIVRPVSDRAVFIQLDDLDRERAERLKPAAFLGLETSPGNYQAWVSIPAGQADKDFARRLLKGAGADDTASGATRVAGSRNFKDKYAPDFPTVQIAYSNPGLMTSPGQLESLGLVAAPEKPAPPILRLSGMERIRTNKWPSYQRCLQDAPETETKPARTFPGRISPGA